MAAGAARRSPSTPSVPTRGPTPSSRALGLAAADGIAVRVFGRTAELAELRGSTGVELIEATEAIRNDDEPVPRGPLAPGRLGRARPPPTSPTGNSDALVSAGLDRRDDDGGAVRDASGSGRPPPGPRRPAPGPARRERPVLHARRRRQRRGPRLST